MEQTQISVRIANRDIHPTLLHKDKAIHYKRCHDSSQWLHKKVVVQHFLLNILRKILRKNSENKIYAFSPCIPHKATNRIFSLNS